LPTAPGNQFLVAVYSKELQKQRFVTCYIKDFIYTRKKPNFYKSKPKCYIWSVALYGAETWTLRAAEEKHLESFEMWCRRRMEKIIWADNLRNKEVLLRVK
jgi:hypothetical protein